MEDLKLKEIQALVADNKRLLEKLQSWLLLQKSIPERQAA